MNSPKTADFYSYLWKRNNGIFFRGVSRGKGIGYGMMGKGVYVTWDKGMANSFAEKASEKHGGKPQLLLYKLPKNIKLMDWSSKDAFEIRDKSLMERMKDPAFITILNQNIREKGFSEAKEEALSDTITTEIKAKGYDGAISDEVADGIVVFDPAKMKELEK